MSIGEWIQPDDMWVGGITTVTSDRWARIVAWDPEGLDPEVAAAEYAARWTDILQLGSAAFTALAGTGDIIQSDESVTRDEAYPFSRYQNLATSHQSWVAFVELAASIDIGAHPVFEPFLEPGQTVEYEGPEGEYFATHRFQVPSDVDGVFTDGNALPTVRGADTSGIVGSPTYPGAVFDSWDTVLSEVPAPFSTQSFERDADTVTIVALLGPQASGVPRAVDPKSAEITWARWTTSIDQFFGAARLYRPPRYRIHTGEGAWELRQRQNACGNAGGWPLRHRQTGNASGAWPLRHRQ